MVVSSSARNLLQVGDRLAKGSHPQLAKGFPLRENAEVQIKVLSMHLAQSHPCERYGSPGILPSNPILKWALRVRRFLVGSINVSFHVSFVFFLSLSLTLSLLRIFEEWLNLRRLLDLFQQQFDGCLRGLFPEYREMWHSQMAQPDWRM